MSPGLIGTRTDTRRNEKLAPLRDAQELTRCKLYWIPVGAFPVPDRQRQWLMAFLDKIVAIAGKTFGLRPEVFLQARVIDRDLVSTFVETSDRFVPIIGLGKRPSEPLPGVPTDRDIEDLQKGRTQFEFNRFAPGYCYWFLEKAERQQRDVFFGRGGLTIIFLKPDEQTKPPAFPVPKKFFQHEMFTRFGFDIDSSRARSYSLLDGFLDKSKQLCGDDVRADPQFKGLAFILPVLETRHFFQESEEEVSKWFQLFDLYITESPVDNGIVVATRLDWESELEAALEDLRKQGLSYTEIAR